MEQTRNLSLPTNHADGLMTYLKSKPYSEVEQAIRALDGILSTNKDDNVTMALTTAQAFVDYLKFKPYVEVSGFITQLLNAKFDEPAAQKPELVQNTGT